MTLENLAAVSRLTDALSRAFTLDSVYAASLDALHESLGVDRASVLLFDENKVMSFVAWRGISNEYRAAVNGHTPWTPETSDAVPIMISDIEADASLASYLPVFRREKIRALAFFPLNYRDRVIGKFMLYYAEPHTFSEQEISLAKTIAGQIAFGVARVRAEKQVEGERQRLADLIASVPGIVWETRQTPGGNDRVVSFVSRQVEDLLGYDVDETMQLPAFWNDLIVERGQEDLLADSNSAATHQYRLRRRDGRLIWAEVRTSVKREGDKLVMRGVTMDITAQKELTERATLLNSIAETLASSLDYAQTLDRVARLMIHEWCDWCAIDVAEGSNMRRFTERHRDTNLRSIREQVAVPLRGSGDPIGTLLVGTTDPQRHFDDNDRAFIADVGQRIGYAVENAMLYEEAQRANRAKDEFLATLSHELRTPMTATLGWATMLRLRDLPPDMYDMAIETIERSTKAQAKLIDDILDVSRIVTGKFVLNTAPVDLRAVIENAIEAIRPSVDAKGLHLELDFGDVASPIKGDAARIQQVIWNLLSNAVKFTPRGGVISVRLEWGGGDENTVSVVVRDTGNGIPASFLPFVFDRFRQVDSSTTRSFGGLGLGLAIVKSIVEMHGGSVSAASDGEGKGSTFRVTFPAIAPSTAASAAKEADHAPRNALAGLTVLLVEDDEDTRVMLTTTLKRHGANVVAAPNVPAALNLVESQTPHVVVSDIGMPGEDGYSLIMKIRSGVVERVRKDVPAIALTAYARAGDRERVLASGFGYHLAKPVDPMIVVKTIEEAARLITHRVNRDS